MASRVNWRPIATGLFLAALICAPKIVWETRPKHPLEILIVDKTLSELLPCADRCFVLEKGATFWRGVPAELTPELQDRYLGV